MENEDGEEKSERERERGEGLARERLNYGYYRL